MAHGNVDRLSIIVVGGGIGGLAASILLAQSGHDVIVLERKDSDYEGRSTGGISLTRNSTRILEQMGLKDDFSHIADRAYPTRMRYDTFEVVGRDESHDPFYMVHRADLSRILADYATKLGITIHFLASIDSIEDSSGHVVVKLKDGSEFKSDLLVGADGISSQVRQVVFPNVSPQVTPCTVMLVNIPASVMGSNPETAELYYMPPFHTPWGPGKSIVSWTMSGRQIYHLQMCDYVYGTGELYSIYDPPGAPYITECSDPASLQALQSRWADWNQRIQFICKSATSYTKWKIAELPALPSYSSPSRRIVLVGDAAHAIKPFAGQGANMAIEDGQVLSTLLSLMSSKQEIGLAVSVYDKVRLPRLEHLRRIIELNVRIFGMKDKNLPGKQDEQEPTQEDKAAMAEEAKKYGLAAARKWIDEYDADAEARRAWMQHQSSQGIEAKI